MESKIIQNKFLPSFDLWFTDFISLVSLIVERKTEYLICHKSQIKIIKQCYIKYTLPYAGIKMTTFVVIGTDCIGRCISK